jgi:heptosyltransferase III
MQGRHFVLSRVDSIGDVVLVLPMAGILKSAFPGCKVSLLARRYTAPLGRCCEHLDGVYAWDEILEASPQDQVRRLRALGADAIIHVRPEATIAMRARQAGIKLRVGTGRRMIHWLTCNRLVYVHRKRSELHEAQLNIELLRGVGIRRHYGLAELSQYYGLSKIGPLPSSITAHLDPARFNLIMHPKSGGTSREWPILHFAQLIHGLPPEQFNLVLTGSEQEGDAVRAHLPLRLPHVKDLMGQLSLGELIALINAADGLVAVSTGPLHIAAALGKPTLGLYAPLRSKHAGRWGPIGPGARVFQLPEPCAACPDPQDCKCMRMIAPAEIRTHLLDLAPLRRVDAPIASIR